MRRCVGEGSELGKMGSWGGLGVGGGEYDGFTGIGWEVDLSFPAGIGRRMEKAKRRRVGRNAKRQNGFAGGRTIRRGGIPEQEMARWGVVGNPDFGRAEGEPGGGLVGNRGVGKGFAWRECVTNVEGREEVGEKGNRGKENGNSGGKGKKRVRGGGGEVAQFSGGDGGDGGLRRRQRRRRRVDCAMEIRDQGKGRRRSRRRTRRRHGVVRRRWRRRRRRLVSFLDLP